jgi:hypothetical protein
VLAIEILGSPPPEKELLVVGVAIVIIAAIGWYAMRSR